MERDMSSISMNNWVETAILLLDRSLNPVPVELNELDWKSGLSDKNARLAQHISAFANYPDGGYLAYGILNSGSSMSLSKEDVDNIIRK